jgi:ubiquinone/menaquinone biosynthesis C-methylase UbiE
MVEKNFWLLYLAVMTGHIPKTVTLVVSDLEAHLPFADGACQGIMINDCLMYVDHQRAFLAEVTRIAPTRLPGLLTAMHIHAAGGSNIAQGTGLEPAQLTHWLPQTWQGRVFDDQKLFKSLESGQRVSVEPTSLSAQSWPVKKSFSMVGLLNNWSKSKSEAQLVLKATQTEAVSWISFEDPDWV